MQIENFPIQSSSLGSFVLGSSELGQTNTGTLQQIIPAYLYQEYSDDASLQAFIDSYNSLAQGYLQWFLTTPLSVYTSTNINGPLLDWIGQGIYGIQRPVISSVTSRVTSSAYDTGAYDTGPYGVRKVKTSGSVTIVNDDIYKRALTWHLYLGDGRQMSVMWLRRRVARFIYGVNGTDIPADDFHQISIQRSPSGFMGAFGIGPYNTQAYDTRMRALRLTRHSVQIRIPTAAGQIGQIFKQLVNQDALALPFQIKFSVVFY